MEAILSYLNTVLHMEALLRMVVAIVVGGAVGWERERQEKPAGLRTHMMVSLGAATFMIVSLELIAKLAEEQELVQLDPLRSLAGIIGGVGFLGAGTIIQARGSIQGITTAASTWVAAAIGTCCGVGLFRLAITSGALAIVVLWLLGTFEVAVLRKRTTPPDESASPQLSFTPSCARRYEAAYHERER